MSAEAFGAKLLSEVQEESLASLLAELRALQNLRPVSVTGLQELDAIIELCRYPAEQAIAASSRPTTFAYDPNFSIGEDLLTVSADDSDQETSPTHMLLHSVQKPKPVLIHVAHSTQDPSAANTALLYHLTALSILPHSVGGKQGTAVYIDCLNHFSALKLHSVVLNHRRRVPAAPDVPQTSTAQASLAKEALTHLHVLSCSSSNALFDTLRSLPEYLLDSDAHHSSARQVRLLIVNGINTFHWQDRFDAEIARLEGINNPSTSDAPTGPLATQTESVAAKILSQLKSFQTTFECTIIYTATPTISTSGNAPNTYDSSDSTAPNLIPRMDTSTVVDVYSHAALVNLHVRRQHVPQFAPSMTLEECLRDKEKRDEAARKAGYYISASRGGLSHRPSNEAAGNTKSVRMGFGMKIEKDGALTFES